MLSYESPMAVNGKGSSASSPISVTAPTIHSSNQPVLSAMHPHGPLSVSPELNARRPEAEHHVWLVTGPAGCGKSTVAEHLANVLNLPYIEGDEFHPPANVEKMRKGIPLTDADRWDWLTALREEAIRELNAGHNGAVLTCSALKRKYRDVIRVAPYFSPNLHLHFIYLHAPEEVLLRRVAARKNHYMGANMVHSQFDILEPPTSAEVDVISVDVSRTPDEVKADVLDRALQTMGRHHASQ